MENMKPWMKILIILIPVAMGIFSVGRDISYANAHPEYSVSQEMIIFKGIAFLVIILIVVFALFPRKKKS